MAQLNYEIPDELHKALKIEAAHRDKTLKDLIILILSVGVGLRPQAAYMVAQRPDLAPDVDWVSKMGLLEDEDV